MDTWIESIKEKICSVYFLLCQKLKLRLFCGVPITPVSTGYSRANPVWWISTNVCEEPAAFCAKGEGNRVLWNFHMCKTGHHILEDNNFHITKWLKFILEILWSNQIGLKGVSLNQWTVWYGVYVRIHKPRKIKKLAVFPQFLCLDSGVLEQHFFKMLSYSAEVCDAICTYWFLWGLAFNWFGIKYVTQTQFCQTFCR